MTRRNLTKTSVISAAADLADRNGFDALTVSELARHLGVQPASLYAHVRDRAAVLEGVHELALGEIADRVASEVAGRSGRNALLGLVTAYRDFARQCPGRWAALQSPAAASTAQSAAAARLVDVTWAAFRGYELPGDELVHATRIVGATINGLVNLQGVGAFDHRSADTEMSWQRAVDVLDAALRAWPSSDDRPSAAHPNGLASSSPTRGI